VVRADAGTAAVSQDEAARRNSRVAAFDLHYDEVSRDWQGVMHRIYRFLGEPLTARHGNAAMERYRRRGA
jgi:hypothetical protein